MPAISVIVPMRNEVKRISTCLQSLLSQTIPSSEYEIIVVDGMSDDGSLAIVLDLEAESPNLMVLQNPLRIMPAGMNIGLRHARSPIVMVAGAHTSYPSHYLETSLKYLDKTGADVVGGPLLTTAGSRGFASRMIAAILSSRFGVGNAAFRTGLKEGWVDTVPYGAYRKEVFDRCGMYDESLIRAQDCELHARIRRSGGRIYQTPELVTYYHPVSTSRAFWRKAFLDGRWQYVAAVKNPQSLALRRFAPVFMVLLLAGLALTTIFFPATWMLIAAVMLLYLLAGLYFGSTQTGTSNLLTKILLPFFAFPFHVCYGVGTLAGLWHVSRKPARPKPTRTTGPLQMRGQHKAVIKRLFDILVSFCGLLIVSPLLAACLVWIAFDSPGPLFYRGIRAGRFGRPFRICKLRTMVLDAEQIGGAETPANDPRITRAGHFLRRYKFDELPQLLNVLKGDMSLVGPRPEVMDEVLCYSDEEKQLLLIRPGITDWASIKFRDEDEILRGSVDPHRAYHELIRPEKIRLGLNYVQDRSFVKDLRILWLTLRAVLTPAQRHKAQPRTVSCDYRKSEQ
jgi:lipopolysaccharide/colanic/teichoic acid biosynthesis glycosyltransferase/GT2 family glycosyltransferase